MLSRPTSLKGQIMTDTDTLEADLSKLAATISTVVTTHSEAEAAHADKLSAQAALVARILEIARPAARALGTRPKIADTYIVDGGMITDQHAIWRGVILTCDPRQIGPSRKTIKRDDTQGVYEGVDVFLRDDGALVELSYEGSWSLWQGTRCEWRATEHEITVEEFCRDWTAADPAKLVAQLLALAEAAGDRTKAIAKARARMDKFRAVLALL
jgi:hypothetical protein